LTTAVREDSSGRETKKDYASKGLPAKRDAPGAVARKKNKTAKRSRVCASRKGKRRRHIKERRAAQQKHLSKLEGAGGMIFLTNGLYREEGEFKRPEREQG